MITIIWLLTLTVCGAKGECVSQVIQDFEDQDKCLTIQQEYEDYVRYMMKREEDRGKDEDSSHN